MSDKNLPIGDTTYQHTPNTFPTELIDQLRFCANVLEDEYGYNIFPLAITKSIERIEQLERELAAVKTQFERYENSDFDGADCMLEYRNLKELIDSIKEGKA